MRIFDRDVSQLIRMEVNRKRQIICDFFSFQKILWNYYLTCSELTYLILVDLFARLFRICWLRLEMPFLKLLNSTYWQEGRAVTSWTLENCPTAHIRTVSPRRAAELPSPCVHPHTLPLPQLSPDGGRKVKRTEEQELLYTGRRGGGKKDMKKPNSFVSRWNLFPSTQKMTSRSLHYQRLEAKAELNTWAVLKVSTVISLALKILA